MRVGEELGYMYWMSRAAGKLVYVNMVGEQVCDTVTVDPHVSEEKKGDLVDFVMAFGSVAP